MKKTKLSGFTLMELIVVICIIGVLAAVIVPNMIWQIQKSKYNTAQRQALSIFNAAQTVVQKYEAVDRAIPETSDKIFGGTHSYGNLSGVDFEDDFSEFYSKIEAINTNLKNCSWAVTVKDYKVTHVLYSSDEEDNYVGVYCDCEAGIKHSSDNLDSYEKEDIIAKWNELP